MTQRPCIEAMVPILNVRDFAASVEYYEKKLGFTNADWAYPGFTAVSRDGKQIFLCHDGQGHAGTWIWIGVDDAQAMYEELVASGAKVRHAPRNYPWALEFHVEDPDGHILRFGSDPVEGRRYDEWAE